MAQSINLRPGHQAPSEFRPTNNGLASCNPYDIRAVFTNDIVQYKCGCGYYRPLYNTYFCRYCLTLRCRSCISHEVDSQYCQQCLEYIPTIDPKFQMNKCPCCYKCPSCHHLLTTSVLSVSPLTTELPQEKSTKQIQEQTDKLSKDEAAVKTYQLNCQFCRWSSVQFTSEDSRSKDSLGDIEISNLPRIKELFDSYKSISQREKSEKKRRKFPRSGKTMDLLKKYGLDNTLSPKLFESLRVRTNFNEKYSVDEKKTEDIKPEELKPAEPLDLTKIPKLDEDFYYGKSYQPDLVSSVEQRLALVELQPQFVRDFKPLSKSLSVKRSLRCKVCDRNVCRSEYSPESIEFKIQNAAFNHIPQLKLRTDIFPIRMVVNEQNIIELCAQNQTLSKVKLKLEHLENHDGDNLYDLSLPQHELSLGPKDDTVDYKHIPFNLRPLNEETQITFQSPFKVGFFVKVKPRRPVDHLTISFAMLHDVSIPPNSKESEQSNQVRQIIKISLGPAR